MRFSTRNSLFLETGMYLCVRTLTGKLLSSAVHSWWGIWDLQLRFLVSWCVTVILFLYQEMYTGCEDALPRSSFNCLNCRECYQQHPSAVSTLGASASEGTQGQSPIQGQSLTQGMPSSECWAQGITSWLSHLHLGQLWRAFWTQITPRVGNAL